MNKLYILLPVYNRKEITRLFIECLCKQTFTNYHLIVIDDGSTDGTDEMVMSYIDEAKLTIIKGGGDWWWAGSLQQGINWLKRQVCKDSLVLFINDDVTFDNDFLERGVENLQKTKDTLLLARLFDKETKEVKESGVNADLKRLTFKSANNTNLINCLSTRGLLLKLTDIKKIGDFYPTFLPHYWSDYEYTIRAYRKGFSLRTCNAFYLNSDETQTGLHFIDDLYLLSFLAKLFSKKSVPNPIYRTFFIILLCPIAEIPVLVMKTWLNSFVLIAKQIKYSFSLKYKSFLLKLKLLIKIEPLKIILGAGSTNQQGWLSTDYPIVDVLDINTLHKYFGSSRVDALLAEHVWEHLTEEDAFIATKNCFDILKPGGYFRIAVPDGYHTDIKYIDDIKPGGKGAGSDDHKVLYNYKSICDLLSKVGFQVKLLEWFDDNGDFNASNWSEVDGFIARSTRFDIRNIENPTQYTSLIIDAIKP